MSASEVIDLTLTDSGAGLGNTRASLSILFWV